MGYGLYNNGNFSTRDGVTTVGDMTPDVDGGAVKTHSTSLQAGLRNSKPNEGDNLSPSLIGGANTSFGHADWSAFAQSTTGITRATGTLSGLMQFNQAGLGLGEGSLVNIGTTTGVYNGIYRVVHVMNSDQYVLDGVWNGTNTGVQYATSVGTLGGQAEGNFIMKRVSANTHGVANSTMKHGAADYGRNDVAKMTALRTRKVATAIRAGYWNPFTGEFTTAPSTANDYTSLDLDGSNVPDDEAKKLNSQYGVGGEFAYRTGKPTPASGSYDGKNT